MRILRTANFAAIVKKLMDVIIATNATIVTPANTVMIVLFACSAATAISARTVLAVDTAKDVSIVSD